MEGNIETKNKKEQINKLVDYYNSPSGVVTIFNKTLKELSELSVECWKCLDLFDWSNTDLILMNVVLRTNLTIKLASSKLMIEELTNLLQLDSVVNNNLEQKIHEQFLQLKTEEKIKGKNI